MRAVSIIAVAILFAARPASAEPAAHVRAQLDRIAELNPRLNAVIAVDPTAMDQARGCAGQEQLACATILIKDNIETAGTLPTTAGSLALTANVTNRDAPLVARIRRANGIILGKANLSEWANFRSGDSVSGWSAVGGQARNPHALDRNPCGSSSGSAVAVAAGLADMAVGTETDGSVTCPAAMNGIVGLKPTVGFISRTHVIPISASQDTPGPMTRTVTDALALLRAMAGSDPADPATRTADAERDRLPHTLDPDALRGKRIGVMRFASGFSAPTDILFEQALGVLRAQGVILVDLPAFPGRERIGPAEFTVLLTEFKAGLNAYLATTPPAVRARTLADIIAFNQAESRELALFGQETFVQAEATSGLDDSAYREAKMLAQRLAGPDGIDRLLRDHDLAALIGPTIGPAVRIDTVNGDRFGGSGGGSLAAVAGYPHLTVPMGAVRSLPVGLSFIGPAWSDGLLLQLGFAYEQASHARIEPRMIPSIEEDAAVTPLLRPAR